jgi:hypothetical protein
VTDPTAVVDGADDHVRAVARGGAFNLVGSIVYGASSFILLAIITNGLGARRAGPVIVAIAAFTVLGRFAELGASTGLVRIISRERALHRADRIAPTILAAVVPVVGIGLLFAGLLVLLAPALAQVFGGHAQRAEIARLLRALAPFLPVAAVYTVLVQGTRGFGHVRALVWIEKIGRALAMPVVVLAVLAAGGGSTAVIVAWASTTVLALGVVSVVVVSMTRSARLADVGSTAGTEIDRGEITRAFWRFSLPRAAGQSFDVAVLWLDTLVVSALIGPTAAGIYAVGSRFLLIGAFTMEAIQQAVAPRVSELLARDLRRDAHDVITRATAWQAALVWPVYLIVIAFATVMLRWFGPEYVRAHLALVLLSVGVMLAVLCGPSDAVILMSGRSRQSLANSAVAFVVNLGGNLLLVPIWGISAAGGVWAVTLLVAAGMPAVQARRGLHLAPWSIELARVVAMAVGTVGVAALVARVVLGESLAGLVVAAVVGGTAYLALIWRFRGSIHVESFLSSLRTARSSNPVAIRPAQEH